MDSKDESLEKTEELKVKRPWHEYVTVEPTMFLYMLAFMITSVVEQTFYVFRACTVDHGYSEDICYNISAYEDISKEVQKTTSVFHQWNSAASHGPPMVLAFFLGAHSDRRGRKGLILAGLLGKLYFSCVLTLNALNAWPVRYIIYTATLPSALTAADLAIFTGCFAYVADVSSVRSRTLRIGILDAVYMSAMPTGVALGEVLFYGAFGRSFAAMFAVNAALVGAAAAYSARRLAWRTRAGQRGWRAAGAANPLADVFRAANVRSSLATLARPRADRRRLLLWLLFLAVIFYTFQRDEKPVMYMYTTHVFKWEARDFSRFRTFLSSAYVLALLAGIPLMTKVLNWRDTAIVAVGAASHVCGHIIYARAQRGGALYAGATAAALGPVVPPLLRAMISKVLPAEEKGVAFAFLAVMEQAVGLVAGVVYARLYAASLHLSRPNGFLYFTAGTQAAVLLLALSIELVMRGRCLESLPPPAPTITSASS